MGVLLKGGKIITSEKSYQGDIRIEREKIRSIGENIVQGRGNPRLCLFQN